ncbi:MAG TPA: protein-disulfide reductase DsbD [Burkholderiales bacterium]|nr:protein-disulfide reductase DsbD [Burkholderiales bacterium]
MRLIAILLLLLPLCAAATQPDLLDPSQAFRFSARNLDAQTVEVSYEIAPGYFLYRQKFKFSAQPTAVTFGPPQFPAGMMKADKLFGNSEIYRDQVRIVLPVSVTGQSLARFTLTAVSQGCADIGVCYAPQEHKAEIVLAAISAPAMPSTGGALFLQPAIAGTASLPLSEDARIATLFRGGFWMLIASFFGFGLLLAFTPCMFPLIPILSGILVPHGQHLTHLRGFLLSLVYVFGMAITYALAGVAAGLLGHQLAATLQSPWVLGGFALIFVALALSMFGLYELQLPTALQTRLSTVSGRLHGGHFASVFTIGILSALIIGPCVAPPLAGALLVISKQGDVVLGGSALFVMALGMGVPLLVVGASAGALLPKSGPWMEAVNKAFGIILLGVAIYLVSPVIPVTAQMLLWSTLLIVSAMYLHAIDPLPPAASGYRRLGKGVGIIGLLAGIALLAGALSGGRDVLQPLAGLRIGASDSGALLSPSFQRVDSSAELDAAVRAAAGRPVLFDFYADWCVTCKEMERLTFTDPEVRARLDRMLMLQADVTADREEHKALLKRFDLFGPPGIVFFNSRGKEITGLHVVGFQSAQEFSATLDRVLSQ